MSEAVLVAIAIVLSASHGVTIVWAVRLQRRVAHLEGVLVGAGLQAQIPSTASSSS